MDVVIGAYNVIREAKLLTLLVFIVRNGKFYVAILFLFCFFVRGCNFSEKETFHGEGKGGELSLSYRSISGEAEAPSVPFLSHSRETK